MPSSAPGPAPLIESRIYVIRGQKVLIDADLASLYGVLTKNLNLAVRRNRTRFPEDFMFQLTAEETNQLFQGLNLRLQFATSSSKSKRSPKNAHGGRRYRPYAFTEQGISMLSSVLTSETAIQVNIAIMRSFVSLRQLIATNEDLALRISELERQQLDQSTRLDQNDANMQYVFSTIDQLLEPAATPAKRPMGFPVSRAGAINEY